MAETDGSPSIADNAIAAGWIDAADGSITDAGADHLEAYEYEAILEAFQTKTSATSEAEPQAGIRTEAPARAEQVEIPRVSADAPLPDVIAAYQPDEILAYVDQFAENPLGEVPADDPWAPLEHAAWTAASKVCLAEGLKPADMERFVQHLAKHQKLQEIALRAVRGDWDQLRAAAQNFRQLR
ncbi:hypothetical protein K2X89_11050 [Myxococcota bacterium]|nr:hypothetical protein [Myxococcota bacterium]